MGLVWLEVGDKTNPKFDFPVNGSTRGSTEIEDKANDMYFDHIINDVIFFLFFLKKLYIFFLFIKIKKYIYIFLKIIIFLVV